MQWGSNKANTGKITVSYPLSFNILYSCIAYAYVDGTHSDSGGGSDGISFCSSVTTSSFVQSIVSGEISVYIAVGK